MSAMLSKLIQKAREIYPGHTLTLAHILLAWKTSDTNGELAQLLAGIDFSIQKMEAVLLPQIKKEGDASAEIVTRCLSNAQEGPATGYDLLRTLTESKSDKTVQMLEAAGLNLIKLRRRLDENERPLAGIAYHGIIGDESDSNSMNRYGRDLTELARQGEFNDLHDRPDEIEKLIQVVLCRKKRNGVLTGQAGVGKTALVELFARKIACGQVPEPLKNCTLFEIRMSSLVAGTKYRGQFEERMEKLINFLLASPETIAFIDEMHLLWGAGRAEGVITDAANILKPYLARGKLQVLGATTVEEYQQYIAQDEALVRRFQEIRLSEPDDKTIERMVTCQAKAIASHHNLNISPAVIRQAIELSNLHLPQRRQPDKAVDLIDTGAVAAFRHGKAALCEAELLETIEGFTGRKITRLDEDGRDSLVKLASRLKTRIIGQNEAIDKICATLIYRRQGLGKKDRCLGTFIFAGDTGIGKTETAKVLAEEFFGTSRALLHLDLAEYSTEGHIHKLLGSPPGYSGSNREGVLINWLQTNGSGVILFDEVEKAHPDIHKMLLGLLDNGRIMTNKGKILDATQCIIILTTNAVTSKECRQGAIGFQTEDNGLEISTLLQKTFPPEFIGRLDEAILFHTLGQEEFEKIITLRLREALERFQQKGIVIKLDEKKCVKNFALKCRKNKIDARGITRLLERDFLQSIALQVTQKANNSAYEVEINDRFYETGKISILQRGRYLCEISN